MRLIANKPCSFGGRQFYIGDEIPANLVADARTQEKRGVITIANDAERVSGSESGTLFTQVQVETMITEAVEEAEKKRADQLAELQEYVAELEETEPALTDGMIRILVKVLSGEDKTDWEVIASHEEIRQVFSIMQLNADEGVKEISKVTRENVLILLHAADSRKMIKNAAKEQADKLHHPESVFNEASTDNVTIGTNTEGADT